MTSEESLEDKLEELEKELADLREDLRDERNEIEELQKELTRLKTIMDEAADALAEAGHIHNIPQAKLQWKLNGVRN